MEALLLSVFLMNASPSGREILRNAGADYVQRSLDKTIIVTPQATYTVPAPYGSGTTYIVPLDEKKRRDHVGNSRRSYRERR